MSKKQPSQSVSRPDAAWKPGWCRAIICQRMEVSWRPMPPRKAGIPREQLVEVA